MKFLKNLRKDKLKNNRGAVSLLVALTLLTFITILTGTFVTVSILRKSQSDSNIRIKQIYEADVDNIDEVYNSIILHANRTDGEWNRYKGVNNPKLYNTGLIPIYFDENGDVVELTSSSSQDEWDDWYDYDNQKWANAITKDSNGNITGYFVWIPRFEYSIDSTNKTISVNFIPESVHGAYGNVAATTGYTTDANGITTTTKDGKTYIIHPAFTNESSYNYQNGGWDNDISGFWVAKYAAGFQNATYGENAITVQYSPTLKYTTVNESYTSNYLTDTITENVTSISYPVFKANTAVYNVISTADSYLISKEIKSATSMYGLSNIDSHLEKNSEWGAVAYLAQSKYGLNGNSTNMNEIAVNSVDLNNTIYVNNASSGTLGNVYAVTGYGNDQNPILNDVNASSTKNITGVYDLSGCVWERTANYKINGSEGEPNWNRAMLIGMTTINDSTKYVTLYPDSYANCTKVGDALKETSTSGVDSNSWNADYSNYGNTNKVVLIRGGRYAHGTSAGLFAFDSSNGSPSSGHGFRVVLIVD